MGSAFRGGVGIQLKQAFCPTPERECEGCAVQESCVYYALYENKSQKVGGAAPPRPILLVPPFFGREMRWNEGAILSLGLILFGDYIRYLPHIVHALSMLGKKGIGSRRCYGLNQFMVSSITSMQGKEVYRDGSVSMENITPMDVCELSSPLVEQESALTVRFKTPMVLKSGGFPPSLDRLLWMVRQRLILYVNEYGDGARVPSFECISEVLSSNAHFHVLRGVSSRAGARQFYAYTGEVEYRVHELDESARWLLAVGSLIGAGPKASFAMGFFDVESARPHRD